MATMLSQKLVEAQEANDTVRWFVRNFEVGKLLSVCRAHKAKGFSVVELSGQGDGSFVLSFVLTLFRSVHA